MKLNLSIDPDVLTLDDLIFLEEHTADLGHAKARELKGVLARFACDENGAKLGEADAEKAVGALTLAELKSAIATLTESVKKVKEQAVPPASGNVSS